MKTKYFALIFLFSCIVPSCGAKEDGDINKWIGTYHWSTNEIQYWTYSLGTRSRIKTDYHAMEQAINMTINQDKTWKFPDPKGPDLGKKGKIRCYKDHINLLDMQNDYLVNPNYSFKLETENSGTYLRYYEDTSSGRIGDHYDYTITTISFKLVNN